MKRPRGVSKRFPLRRFLLVAAFAAGLFVVAARRPSQAVAALNIQGSVAGSYFTPPAGSTFSSTAASYFGNAKVCVDLNNDAVCNPAETSTTTDANGFFTLVGPIGPLTAEVSTASTNGGHPVSERIVFRAAMEQVAEKTVAGQPIVVSPLTTEVVRMMEAGGITYDAAKQSLAMRLGIPASQATSDPNTPSSFTAALLRESVILTNRFVLAGRMVDRHDVSLAVLFADPTATGPAITMREAEQAAMNLEYIPRYDHIFIIMLENRQTPTIKGSAFAPNINAYLNAYNQFTSYNATGNPSEPNYTALGGGDDFGITDDSAWNCVPSGDNADLPEDLPLPPGMSACTNATNHNIKNRRNLFNGVSAAGLTWRIYNESQNPGLDFRSNSVADATLLAPDHIYPAGSPVGAIGNPDLSVRFATQLQATKHNPTMAFQNVRSAPEFASSQRTLGGGQWDDAIKASPNTPAGWDVDQFGTDLASGNVGNLNFLIPDQCDDMHGLTVTGPIAGTTSTGTASDCGGNALIYRSDRYVGSLVAKIQASPLWMNPQKRVAIVIVFDEGTATTGLNSCCGWNPIGKPGYSATAAPLGVLVKDSNGTISVDASIVRYSNGNKGHGTSVFGVITNQPNAPRGVVDSDAYSHFSFVRTIQDMFQLADPGDDFSYMNRSKYTEKFIAANINFLPEYAANISDPHFDAVRPMNHRFVIPQGYAQKTGFVPPPGPGPQVGPDANQTNAWAVDGLSPKLWRPAPAAGALVSPSPNAAGWNNTPVSVNLHATDDAGSSDVQSIQYALTGAQGGGQTVQGNQAAVGVTMEGQTTVSYLARNFLGTPSGTQQVDLHLDLTPPSIVFSGNAGTYAVDQYVDIGCSAWDALSGLASSTCPTAKGPAYAFSLGANQLAGTALDRAGNQTDTGSVFNVIATYGSLSNLTKQFVTSQGIANSLNSKLSAAADAAARGNASAKAGALNAYGNEVAAQSGKSLTAAQADLLRKFAGAL